METTHCVFHDPISVKQSYKIFHFSFFPFPLMGVSLFYPFTFLPFYL